MEENKPEPPPSPTRVGRGKICRHWYKGHCWLDTTCGFLHPPRETMPPNLVFEYKSKQQEKSTNTNAEGEPVQKKEHTGGRVCHHWERGYCWLGNTCGFLHTELPRTTVQYPGYQGGYTGMGGKMGEVPQMMHHYNQQQPYRNGVRIASPPRQPNYHVRPPNLINGMQNVNPTQMYHTQHHQLANVPVQVPQMHHQQHSPHQVNSPIQMIPQQSPPNTNSPVQLQQEAYPPLTGGHYYSS